jgi:hypothetical protein
MTRISFGELPAVTVRQGDYMWALDRRGNTIAKVDVEENAVVDEFRLEEKLSPPDEAWDMATVGGSLWLTAPSTRRFYELDAETGRVLSTVRTRSFSTEVHVAAGSLWFVDDGEHGSTSSA